ncbi:MAG: Crp/Fnr family transcriptional regulator [Planctomycetaceae bacterium]|nr:Crp/Fnr family transcriptional regulator [Planctomycetaceae bacterium]
MEASSIQAALGRLAFAEEFSPDQMARLAELTTRVQWEAGDVVFREGEVGIELYVVEEGRVDLVVSVPGRGTVRLQAVGPGEIFGWSSVYYMRPKTASALVVEPTRALALNGVMLRALCDSDFQLGYVITRRLLRVASERLKATRLQMLDLLSSRPDAHADGPKT